MNEGKKIMPDKKRITLVIRMGTVSHVVGVPSDVELRIVDMGWSIPVVKRYSSSDERRSVTTTTNGQN